MRAAHPLVTRRHAPSTAEGRERPAHSCAQCRTPFGPSKVECKNDPNATTRRIR